MKCNLLNQHIDANKEIQKENMRNKKQRRGEKEKETKRCGRQTSFKKKRKIIGSNDNSKIQDYLQKSAATNQLLEESYVERHLNEIMLL